MAHLLLLLVLDGTFFGGPFRQGVLPEHINEASGMVASATWPVLWVVNDSGGDPSVYGVTEHGNLRIELKLSNASNVDWEDIAYHPASRTIYVADIGDNSGKRTHVRVYAVAEPTLSADTVLTVQASHRDLVYPDGARDAETLLCDPRNGSLYIVSKRERQCRLYAVPKTSDTLRFVCTLPFYLATGGDVSADGNDIVVKNYTHVYHWSRIADEALDVALHRKPTRVHYMPEIQGESIAFAHDGSGYYTVTERENGGPPAPVEFYPRVATAADVDRVRDVRRPSIQLVPVDSSAHQYVVRYAVTEESNIVLSVRNALGMTVRTIEDDSREAGAQERTFDMADMPDGAYVLVLVTRTSYASLAFEFKHD